MFFRKCRIYAAVLALLVILTPAYGIMSRWTPLKLAAYRGDLQKVRELLQAGVPAGGELEHGLTPLHWAATRGYREVAEILIVHGANVTADRTDAHCNVVGTPLHCAAFMGHIEVARVLIANGARVNYISMVGYDMVGGTALHQAARGGRAAIAKLLIGAGADPNAKGYKDKTALHYASSAETARVLLQNSADAAARDADGHGPLYYAVRSVRPGVARELVAGGARPTLHSAAMTGDAGAVELLIGRDANVNCRDMLGRTPLFLAADKRTAETLLHNGAKADLIDRQGGTALHEAARHGRREIAELLLKEGAPIGVKDRWGSTPMSEAVRFGRLEIVELFIRHGWDVKSQGCELVFGGAAFGRRKTVELLLRHAAAFDAKSSNGYTPLHIAVFCRHRDVVGLLIEKGADVNTATESGFTPLHTAVERSRGDIAAMLISAGANLDAVDNRGRTALQLAEKLGRADIARMLRLYCSPGRTSPENDKPPEEPGA